jgi:hypothetical protein
MSANVGDEEVSHHERPLRDWDAIEKSRVEAIMLDTEQDCPHGIYTPAEVYDLTREVLFLRESLEHIAVSKNAQATAKRALKILREKTPEVPE